MNASPAIAGWQRRLGFEGCRFAMPVRTSASAATLPSYSARAIFLRTALLALLCAGVFRSRGEDPETNAVAVPTLPTVLTNMGQVLTFTRTSSNVVSLPVRLEGTVTE